MDDLVGLLYEIRKKPVLYFGNRRTLAHLSNFILGFVTGREGTNKVIDGSTNWFNPSNGSFQDFVVKKFQITFHNHGTISLNFIHLQKMKHLICFSYCLMNFWGNKRIIKIYLVVIVGVSIL